MGHGSDPEPPWWLWGSSGCPQGALPTDAGPVLVWGTHSPHAALQVLLPFHLQHHGHQCFQALPTTFTAFNMRSKAGAMRDPRYPPLQHLSLHQHFWDVSQQELAESLGTGTGQEINGWETQGTNFQWLLLLFPSGKLL